MKRLRKTVTFSSLTPKIKVMVIDNLADVRRRIHKSGAIILKKDASKFSCDIVSNCKREISEIFNWKMKLKSLTIWLTILRKTLSFNLYRSAETGASRSFRLFPATFHGGWSVGRTDWRTDGRTGGRTGGRTNGRTNEQTDERTDERTDGQTVRRTDERTDGRTNRRTDVRADTSVYSRAD